MLAIIAITLTMIGLVWFLHAYQIPYRLSVFFAAISAWIVGSKIYPEAEPEPVTRGEQVETKFKLEEELPREGSWFGGRFIPRAVQNFSFLILGMIGSGKTLLIKPLIRGAIARKEIVILLDIKGEIEPYLRSLGADPIVLMPFAKNCHIWDVCEDVTNKLEAEEFAIQLMGETERMTNDGTSAYFKDISSDIASSSIQAFQKTWYTLADIVRALESIDTMREVLKTTEDGRNVIQTQLENAEDALKNTISNIRRKVKELRKIAVNYKALEGNPHFSIKSWLKERHPRPIIIGLPQQYADTLRPFTQTILMTIMARLFEQQHFREETTRVWFFLDEFPRLGLLKKFGEYVSLAREKGFCFVVGAQDYDWLVYYYGQALANVIFSCLGCKAFLRTSSDITAKKCSELFGEFEGYRIGYGESSTTGTNSNSRGDSTSWNLQRAPAILPSEFCSLPLIRTDHVHAGYYKVPGMASWRADIPEELMFRIAGKKTNDEWKYFIAGDTELGGWTEEEQMRFFGRLVFQEKPEKKEQQKRNENIEKKEEQKDTENKEQHKKRRFKL